MTRSDVLDLLDGTHPTFGRGPALILHGIIIASAFAIAVETMPNLPPGLAHGLEWFELAILLVFTAEYATRVICAPKPLRYIFSFWGLVDLLAILPLLALINPSWTAVRIFRLLRLVRLLKLFRTSRALDRLDRALLSVRGELIVFGVLALMVLYVAAVGIYVFEHPAQPEAFSSIPMSMWWAVASLTTVGYGDLVLITVGGASSPLWCSLSGLALWPAPRRSSPPPCWRRTNTRPSRSRTLTATTIPTWRMTHEKIHKPDDRRRPGAWADRGRDGRWP